MTFLRPIVRHRHPYWTAIIQSWYTPAFASLVVFVGACDLSLLRSVAEGRAVHAGSVYVAQIRYAGIVRFARPQHHSATAVSEPFSWPRALGATIFVAKIIGNMVWH